MAIPEDQLEVWAKAGSQVVSENTFTSVKTALERQGTKYFGKSVEIFLQGSYGNGTNIRSESDVDIVIRLRNLFHLEFQGVQPTDQYNIRKEYSDATYLLPQFKNDVVAALVDYYGVKSVDVGQKAIKIKQDEHENRREADVIVADTYRRYDLVQSKIVSSDGISFLSNGERINNFPHQHTKNGNLKDIETGGRYKEMVRLLKNMRLVLIERGLLVDGSAPSYFIEGLLYNVPSETFMGTLGQSFVTCLRWLNKADQSALKTPSGLHWVTREGRSTCWPCQQCSDFISAVISTWNHW
jgi:hypothetical protein